MDKEQQEYVRGVELWLAYQQLLVTQVDAAITYSRLEIDLHSRAIDANTALLKHYVDGIEGAKARLETYIKENTH